MTILSKAIGRGREIVGKSMGKGTERRIPGLPVGETTHESDSRISNDVRIFIDLIMMELSL